MAKQKCGTCRFFQEAGLAGSGWCHHPQRKVSSGVMIMVRRNELACRDEWSRSLWAEAEPGQRSDDEIFQRPPNLGPLPPAAAADLQALVRAEATSAAMDGEDVLLSEARIVSEQHEPPAPPPTPRADLDSRSAVFRARERYRERNRARESAARQSGAALPIVVGIAGADDLDESVPAIHDAEQPRDVSDPAGSLEAFGTITPALAEHEEMLVAHAEPVVSDLAAVEASEWSLERFLADDPEPLSEELVEPELTLDRLDELDERSLPAWFRTDLPRVCRTCRDFRPSADGRRGWCANAWAFTHRRMVHEDDAAPCDSSIGDWWVAVDDVWLVAADVSAHGRATPLLDRLTGKERAVRRRS